MPIVQNVMKTGAQVAGAVRDLGRLREIVQVLIAHGFGFLIDQIDLPGVSIIRRIQPGVEDLPLQVRATLAIQQLGPTFVKLGQVLSTRPDLIPASWCKEFESLQDNVQQVPYRDIAHQIKTSLGKAPEDLFVTFEVEPLAAASMAQVHLATLEEGTTVVVKVQRPGLRRIIERDLDILRFLARQVSRQLPDLDVMDFEGMVGDFEKAIMAETDFTIEANNTERFARNLADLEGIHVPAIYRAFSSGEVLCQEFIIGVKMRDARGEGHDMRALGKLYFKAAARMLFEDGFFHGDLHPGNVLVMEGGELGIIDFGMAGSLTEDMRDNFSLILFGVSRKDFRTVARVMFELGIKVKRVEYARFEGEVMELMQRHVVGRSMGEIQIGGFLNDLLQGCLRYGIKVPSGYTMLFKAIMTTEGLAKDLLPEMDPIMEFQPVLEKVVRARFSRDRLSRDMTVHLMSLDLMMRRLPIIGAQMASDYEAGRLKLPILEMRDPDVERRADARHNRIGAAVVESSLILASVMSMDKPQWSPFGVPVITLGFFAVTFMFGVWILLAALRSGFFNRG